MSFNRFLPYCMVLGAVMLQSQKGRNQEPPYWSLCSGSGMQICAERPKRKWLSLLVTSVLSGLDLGDCDFKM